MHSIHNMHSTREYAYYDVLALLQCSSYVLRGGVLCIGFLSYLQNSAFYAYTACKTGLAECQTEQSRSELAYKKQKKKDPKDT